VPGTPDRFLWWAIRDRQEAISYQRYEQFINAVLCVQAHGRSGERQVTQAPDLGEDATREQRTEAQEILLSGLQYVDRVRGWHVLREATELFLMVEAGLAIGPKELDSQFVQLAKRFSDVGPDRRQDPLELSNYERGEFAEHERDRYLKKLGDGYSGLPYTTLILDKLGELPLKHERLVFDSSCYGILYDAVSRPVMLELIWSYWMEQGMLAQTMAALSLRFQNKRLSDRDPLANLEIDPLRGVSNLIWGFIQDEQNRLTVQRRAYEYLHEYGLELTGRAIPQLQPVDRRGQFLRAFHDLLGTTYAFYQADDDTTVHADPFPVLNALQTLHMVLAEGAHNQFGDLPWTARAEMLCQQWILARPEMREFMGGRIMVPYREPWMDRVDAMRQLQSWGDVSITHFRDLATYGEMLLLTVRWGAWSTLVDPDSAANWARAWRPEVQMYIHAYRAVTGVDLKAEATSSAAASERYEQPALYLERLLAKTASRNGRAAAAVR
jgi:hypothetical protein